MNRPLFQAFFFFSCSIWACKNKPVPMPTEISSPQAPIKKETVAPMNLWKAEHDEQMRYWKAADQEIQTKVPRFDTQLLKSAFYCHMKGQFKGSASTLHLHFGHFQGDGEWAFAGNLYVDSLKKAYEIVGYLDSNRIHLYGNDKTQTGEAVWIGFATFDAQHHLKGMLFHTRDVQQGSFDFQEVPVANSGVALTFEECYAKRICDERYKAQDDTRIYSVVWMHHGWHVGDPKAGFLNQHLSKTKDCARDTQTFLKKSVRIMETALKTMLKNPEEYMRNHLYFELDRTTINWNQDHLLVLRRYDYAETEIYSYGGQGIEFTTYDLKRKRLLTSQEVFKPDYDEDAFARAVYNHLDWTIDKADSDNEGKLSLKSNEISNGFTSKGFYLIGNGNHGFTLDDKFVAYEAVEPFLRDDFKRDYWIR